MRKRFIYQIFVVQYVAIDIRVDFMVITVIRSIMNMIYGTHQHVSIAHAGGIIVFFVRVFSVSISFVLNMKFKKPDPVVVVYHVDRLNSVPLMVV